MKKIFLLATTALALAACSNDDNYVDRPVAAQFTATIGQSNVSRVSGSSWDKNDMIGITTTFNNQVGPFINMRYTTAEGDGAFAGNTIYIYNPMSLTAYYPFAGDEGTAPKEQGVISAVTDAEHQQPENQKKIDFLFASKAEITTDDANVALEFSHKMSKLTFIFIDGKGADVSKISAYKIEGLALEGSFDTATGVCAAKSDVATLSMDVESVKSGEAVPSLVLFPQSTYGKEITLTITDSENQAYSCKLSFTNDTMNAGNNYLYSITVNKTGLTINQSSINEWDEVELAGSAGSSD